MTSAHYTLLIPPALRSTPSSPQIKHREEQESSSRITGRHALIALLVALAFGGVLLQTNLRFVAAQPATIQREESTSTGSTVPKRKVLVRFNSLSDEGVGSAPQHFKSSILLADLLDRAFVVGQLDSEHGYSTSDIFNAGAAAHGNLEFALPMCELQEQGAALWKRLRKACESPRQRSQLQFELNEKYGHCGTLYHNVREPEVIQDLNGCVHEFFQRTLRHPICEARWEEADRQAYATAAAEKQLVQGKPGEDWSMFPASAKVVEQTPIRVGVHFRWGDTQPVPGQEVDRTRGIQVSELNAALATLAACNVPLDVRVYGEGVPDAVSSTFSFKHALIDSGDSITDLCRLGQSEVIVAGASGYAVMAHQLGRNRLQLVTDVGMYKYADTNTTEFTVMSVNSLDSSVCAFLARPAAP